MAPSWWKDNRGNSFETLSWLYGCYVTVSYERAFNYLEKVSRTWIIDSGVFYYICIEKSWFTTRRFYEVDISIVSFLIVSEGIGTVVLIFDDYEFIFIDVIYVFRLKVNVLFIERLKKDNYIGYLNWLFKLVSTSFIWRRNGQNSRGGWYIIRIFGNFVWKDLWDRSLWSFKDVLCGNSS